MYDFQKINELAVGIESHIRRLEDFTGVLKEIKHSLDEIRHSQEYNYLNELKKIKNDVSTLTSELGKRGLPLVNEYEKQLKEAKNILETVWPECLSESQICRNSDQQKLRAKSILDGLVGEHLKNKKLLDYGCGNENVITEARIRECEAYGYDINLEKSEFIFNNFEELDGPFDIIIMHDVLDHIEKMDPIEALIQVKELMLPETRLYIRNHPWSSRHGGHLYTSINKAFIHLAFDEIELLRIGGYTPDYNIKVVTPLETYSYWLETAGFEVEEHFVIKNEVEDIFFKEKALSDRISKYWNGDLTDMRNNMEIDFVEYTLRKKTESEDLI